MQDLKGRDTIRDPTKPVEKLKRRKLVMTWDLQHTFDSHDSPEESLIPRHLFSSSVWPRYNERVQKVKELKSTTNLRRRLEEKREISELNRWFQEEKGRGEANLRDKLTKQRELAKIDKKWEDM